MKAIRIYEFGGPEVLKYEDFFGRVGSLSLMIEV